jgi:hypothetical protein
MGGGRNESWYHNSDSGDRGCKGIVGVSYFFLGQSDNGGDNEQDVAYQVGDYLEWTLSIAAPNSAVGDPYSIQRYTIVDVGSTWITINRTYMDAARDFLSSSQYSLPVNTTFGSFTAIFISVASNDMTAHGTDIISTKWVNIMADHYQWTNQIGGEDVTSDIWMVGGHLLEDGDSECGIQYHTRIERW